MQIRPIKTKADHREALKAIEKLLGARPGTPDGDRLDVLTTLVERYEEQVDAIEPPDPNRSAALSHGEPRDDAARCSNRSSAAGRGSLKF